MLSYFYSLLFARVDDSSVSIRMCMQAPWHIEDARPGTRWPDEGRVAFEDFATRYRPGLDLVLKGITFSIKGEEKVWRATVATFVHRERLYRDVCNVQFRCIQLTL